MKLEVLDYYRLQTLVVILYLSKCDNKIIYYYFSITLLLYYFRLPSGFSQLHNLTTLGLNDMSLSNLPADFGL